MEIFLLSLLAFSVAILTLFSGFGLGTILTPVFMVLYPVESAITLTAVVHLSNNLFKVALLGNYLEKEILVKFGIPAIIAAIIGAWVLLKIPDDTTLFSYVFNDHVIQVTPVKFIISVLLIVFVLTELLPAFKKLQFSKDKLPIGGILSGFFGGLSGNQGALRSAFLVRTGISKEAFIGTAAVISTGVDISRLLVYSTSFGGEGCIEDPVLAITITAAAIAGSWTGNRLLKKVTLKFVQNTVAVMLIILALCLGSGIL